VAVPRGVGGAITTGSSVCGLCAGAGRGAPAMASRIPSGGATPQSQRRLDEVRWEERARRRDGRERLTGWDNFVPDGEKTDRHARSPRPSAFRPDAADLAA